MFDLLDRLEQMGRRGAPVALGIAGVLLLLAVGLVIASLVFEGGIWASGGARGLAFLFAALAMIFGMFGVRLLTARAYPSPESLFPSLPKDEFKRAVREEERPLCVCTRCLIHLPGQFSTGACPRCASSVEYYEINTDDDADMVILGVQ